MNRTIMSTYKQYVFWFAQEHVPFRKPEILSLIKLFNIKPRTIEKICDETPYWIIELDDEKHCHDICSRSVSVRFCMELWSRSKIIKEFHERLQKYVNTNSDCQKYFSASNTFRITVETYNKHFTQAEKIKKIENLEYIPVKGSVKLTNPDIEYMYYEHYGLDSNNVPEQPLEILFGRYICSGQRQLKKELSLKSRKFIGNTSMDATLSVLAANQALAQDGKIIMDPFVGSGSLLVAAAKFGGYVMGMDIDYLMLHGRTRPSRIKQKTRDKDESILANLKQYQCESSYLDVVVADSSLPLWRPNFKIDAIVTDPPYGIREATERIGTDQSLKRTPDSTDSTDFDHFPAKIDYDLPQLYSDLLQLAATHLSPGGRLVCWFPVFRKDYDESFLPKHKQLSLIANSEQVLSNHTSRRMLTYEKLPEDSQVNDDFDDSSTTAVLEYRHKYFVHSEGTRKEKRLKRHEEQERTKMDKIKARFEKKINNLL
ncbi:tRNA (guanine(10)-N2)-methyltransferase homolog [Ctenocephalides felis]|uniref:tRNA (guanine(10)-N2)-methyltransferase homolog n=1 Tax=Ctenocephalides felis TaxID=7515 RepID=UPI000E6E49AB|nr:tRNA (guanine(10)-N2)-methyltransferase homolog [Ctenocephalides felis]